MCSLFFSHFLVQNEVSATLFSLILLSPFLPPFSWLWPLPPLFFPIFFPLFFSLMDGRYDLYGGNFSKEMLYSFFYDFQSPLSFPSDNVPFPFPRRESFSFSLFAVIKILGFRPLPFPLFSPRSYIFFPFLILRFSRSAGATRPLFTVFLTKRSLFRTASPTPPFSRNDAISLTVFFGERECIFLQLRPPFP